MNTLNTSLDISPDLWNGTLINWSPGFQIKYLINVLAFFFFFQAEATDFISLFTSDGFSCLKVCFFFPKYFSCWGHIPSTDKGSSQLEQGGFHTYILFFFSPARMTPVVITRQPCWISVAVTDKIEEEDIEMDTKRKLHFQAPLHLHVENLCIDTSWRKWSNWRYPKFPESMVAQYTLKSVHFAISFRNSSNYVWFFFSFYFNLCSFPFLLTCCEGKKFLIF